MLPLATLALMFTALTPIPSSQTIVAACMEDVPRDLAGLRGRKAWVARCMPEVGTLASYPEASFVTFLHDRAPNDAQASCTAMAGQAVLCTGEGLLAGQRVLTPEGWRDVAELTGTGTEQVASWDSSAPFGASLPMSLVERTVRRPYRGPIIQLETEEGALLGVSAGQPMLLARGVAVRADSLQLHDTLLGADGLHRLASIKQVHRTTWIYQVVPDRMDFDHNVLLVEGLFVGSTRIAQAQADRSPPPAPKPKAR